MAESTGEWPMGLRFKPTEDELVGYHLTKKLKGEVETICVIPELYIYNWEPPELFARYNELSSILSDGSECFFFCPPRGRKRKTERGFWKETSKKRVVRAPDTGEVIGFKRILVYCKGQQGDARRTHFGIHEYHLNSNVSNSEIPCPMEFVLCHITNRKCKKAGSGSAIMGTRANLTIAIILNNSENEEAQEISVQASPAMTVESESLNHTALNYDLLDRNVSVLQQPDVLGMESSFCNYNWLVDETSNEHHAPCSPSDGFHLSDLWSFD